MIPPELKTKILNSFQYIRSVITAHMRQPFLAGWRHSCCRVHFSWFTVAYLFRLCNHFKSFLNMTDSMKVSPFVSLYASYVFWKHMSLNLCTKSLVGWPLVMSLSILRARVALRYESLPMYGYWRAGGCCIHVFFLLVLVVLVTMTGNRIDVTNLHD